MSNIRAKFRCHFVQSTGSSEIVHMSPVYSSDPESENAQWAKATPGGQLTMHIDNPLAQGNIEQGKEYFIDIEQVPE